MLHARHVFFAWLAYGVLQLALLGTGGVARAAAVAESASRPQSAWPTASYAKRLLAPEPTDRRATITPFAPAAYVRLDAPIVARPEAPGERRQAAPYRVALTLPPARAPPALA